MNINEHMFWFLRSESQQFLAIQHDFILFTYTVSNPNLYILSYILRFQQKIGSSTFFFWKKKSSECLLLKIFPELCPKFILNLQTRVEALRSTIFFPSSELNTADYLLRLETRRIIHVSWKKFKVLFILRIICCCFSHKQINIPHTYASYILEMQSIVLWTSWEWVYYIRLQNNMIAPVKI